MELSSVLHEVDLVQDQGFHEVLVVPVHLKPLNGLLGHFVKAFGGVDDQ